MNIEEAKFILQAYRPGGQDANDPQFAEALQLAKTDPELARWFAGQIDFDGTVSRKLKELRPPPQLKTAILAGNRVIAPAFWTKRRLWLAMAAAFLLLAGVVAVFLRLGSGATQFAEYRKEMTIAAKVDEHHLDLETSDPGEIVAWFTNHQAVANFPLPAGLRGVPSMGCRVLDWHGRKVSMLCYLLEGSKHVDLFVISRKDFPEAPAQERPQFAQSGSLNTVSWGQGGMVYLLIGQGDEAFFRKYVGSQETSQNLPFRAQKNVWNKPADGVSNHNRSQTHEQAVIALGTGLFKTT